MTTTKDKPMLNTQSLSAAIEMTIKQHLLTSKAEILDLYKLVMDEIEEPLYQSTMEHCKYNQSRAALILGVSRGTLRTRLKQFFGDKYVGTRD